MLYFEMFTRVQPEPAMKDFEEVFNQTGRVGEIGSLLDTDYDKPNHHLTDRADELNLMFDGKADGQLGSPLRGGSRKKSQGRKRDLNIDHWKSNEEYDTNVPINRQCNSALLKRVDVIAEEKENLDNSNHSNSEIKQTITITAP